MIIRLLVINVPFLTPQFPKCENVHWESSKQCQCFHIISLPCYSISFCFNADDDIQNEHETYTIELGLSY